MSQALLKKNFTALILAVSAPILLSSFAKADETVKAFVADKLLEKPTTAASDAEVPAGLIQLPPSSQYFSPYAFVVDKTARQLSVWHQTGNGLQEVAHFPADLGKNSGDKRGRGDAKTPEGIYFLQDRLDGAKIDSKIYGKRAFPTDYPNFFDRQEGKTGNGIWLHAVPDTVALTRGSKGCVVVRNNVILELTQYITLKKTPILIQEKTDRVPAAELNKMTADLNQWLESWRTAWQTKNIDKYISYYGDDFKSQHMNKNQWKTFKQSLNDKYAEIEVRLSRPAIMADRNHAIVRFLQEYISDKKSDFGEKVLYLANEGGKFRIVGEQWAEETSQVARDEIEATTHGHSSSASTSASVGPASTDMAAKN